MQASGAIFGLRRTVIRDKALAKVRKQFALERRVHKDCVAGKNWAMCYNFTVNDDGEVTWADVAMADSDETRAHDFDVNLDYQN